MSIEIQIGQNNEKEFAQQWTMDSCYGPKLGFGYSTNSIIYDRCCLPPGQYTLSCIDLKSKVGWGNVTFQIDGKRYCDDFFGYKAMRTVFITGTMKMNIQLLMLVLL